MAQDAYNATAERIGLPKANNLMPPRRRALAARISDLGGLQGWDDMLDRLEHSSDWFRHQFRPGLDWCLKPANLTKIMEGNYDERAQPQTGLAACLAELGRISAAGK